MRTRKDFEWAAEIVRESIDRMDPLDVDEATIAHTRVVMCAAFVRFFREDNPRFDAARFRAACGVE